MQPFDGKPYKYANLTPALIEEIIDELGLFPEATAIRQRRRARASGLGQDQIDLPSRPALQSNSEQQGSSPLTSQATSDIGSTPSPDAPPVKRQRANPGASTEQRGSSSIIQNNQEASSIRNILQLNTPVAGFGNPYDATSSSGSYHYGFFQGVMVTHHHNGASTSANSQQNLHSSGHLLNDSPYGYKKDITALSYSLQGTTQCQWKNCGTVYANDDDLYDHLCEHIGYLGFRNLVTDCGWPECSARWRERPEGVQHVMIHAGKMTPRCDIHGCGMKLQSFHHKEQHVMSHHGGVLANGQQYKPAAQYVPENPGQQSSSGPINNVHNQNLPSVAGADSEEVDKTRTCLWVRCGKAFAHDHLLYEHVGKEHVTWVRGDFVKKCGWSHCSQTWTRHSQAMDHARSHCFSFVVDQAVKCAWLDCGKAFANDNLLYEHLCAHIGWSAQGTYTDRCKWKDCTHAWTKRNHGTDHVKKHCDALSLFACPSCPRTFKYACDREKHLQTDAGFGHSTLSQMPQSQAGLQPTVPPVVVPPVAVEHTEHYQYQAERAPCRWKGCAQVLSNGTALYNHLLDHLGWTAAGTLLTQCGWDDCVRTWKSRPNGVNHLKVHCDLELFPCNFPGCGAVFSRQCNRKRHWDHPRYLDHNPENRNLSAA